MSFPSALPRPPSRVPPLGALPLRVNSHARRASAIAPPVRPPARRRTASIDARTQDAKTHDQKTPLRQHLDDRRARADPTILNQTLCRCIEQQPNAQTSRRTHEYTVRADDEASAQRGCATIAEARRACELTRRGKAPSAGTRDGGRGSGAERCADASSSARTEESSARTEDSAQLANNMEPAIAVNLRTWASVTVLNPSELQNCAARRH